MPARPVLRAPGERQSAASEAVYRYSERASRSMAEKDPLIYQVMSSSNSIRLSSVGSAWMMARM